VQRHIKSEWLLLFNAKWAIFQLYYGEQVTSDEMMMMYTLYYTNMLSRILLLAQWNKSVGRQVAPLKTLFWFWANKSLLLFLSGEATNTSVIVCCLTRPSLEPTIYCTRGENANNFYFHFYSIRGRLQLIEDSVNYSRHCASGAITSKFRNWN
jgi:hypothetical protein